MKSTGNDIVALNSINIQRTVSPTFYLKFVVPAEEQLYKQIQFHAIPFQNFLWLLWSVKESVYKYLKRHDTGLIFSPSKIIVQNITIPSVQHTLTAVNTIWENSNDTEGNTALYTGKVISGSHQFYFQSKITTQFIATVVNDSPHFENVYWGVNSIEQADHENQSKLVREFVLKKLIHVLNESDLRIENTIAGYPIILQGIKQLDVPVSLAHHDHFIAYSFCK